MVYDCDLVIGIRDIDEGVKLVGAVMAGIENLYKFFLKVGV